jgi:CBS domain containing-hemolysin-like protein
MTGFLLSILCLTISLGTVIIRKTYYQLPLKELKRKAERHEKFASKIYPAVAYGTSLRVLLWTVIGFSGAAGFVLLARAASPLFSIFVVAVLLFAAFSWLPATRVSVLGAKATLVVTPSIVWVLNYIHPLVSRGDAKVRKRYSGQPHTGLFERGDVLELIQQQQRQADNRLSDEELSIVQHALSFGDYSVRDITTPRADIKTIKASEMVGPILIDELHQSGQSFVLVMDKPKGMIVGSLPIHKLGIHSEGSVSDHMNAVVYYLHEDDSLRAALHAFFVTNCPLFVVVNSFEEYVGIITVESITKQLLGHIPGDDFEQYTDVVAVAARHSNNDLTDSDGSSLNATDESD